MVASVEEIWQQWDDEGCTLRAGCTISIENDSELVLRVWSSGQIGVGNCAYAPQLVKCGMPDEELRGAIAAALAGTDLVVVDDTAGYSPFYARDETQNLRRRGTQSLEKWSLSGVEPDDQQPIKLTADGDESNAGHEYEGSDSERAEGELFHVASRLGLRVIASSTGQRKRKKSGIADELLVAVLLDVAVDTQARTVAKAAKSGRRSANNVSPTKIIVRFGAVVVQNDDDDKTLTVEGSAKPLVILEVDMPEFERNGDSNEFLPVSKTVDAGLANRGSRLRLALGG